MGLLNISFTWQIHALDEIDISSRREWSKKHTLSLSEGSVQQGRSQFDARSVLPIRERERREERQVCEPEGQANWRERRWRPLRQGSGHVFLTFPESLFGKLLLAYACLIARGIAHRRHCRCVFTPERPTSPNPSVFRMDV
ncbi:MAG: hypothetical protein VST68_09695 [Nitrospirota bacterium]|nr:hypothetical protein [Nitrospirota bacterium]